MTPHRSPIVGFLSGKGGVGKTNIAANVAVASRALGAEVLLIDGALGLANVDALLGLLPVHTAADLLDGSASVEDTVLEGPRGIHVLPAARGVRGLDDRRPGELAGLVLPLLTLRERYDLVVIDIGTGIGDTAVSLSSCCDLAVVVTTPELTSLVDSYAMLKVLAQEAPTLPVEILVNGSRDATEARRVHEQIARIAREFLSLEPGDFGFVHTDARLAEAVREQKPVVELYPTARSSRALVRIAERLLHRPPRIVPPEEALSTEVPVGAPS